jgi:cytochrome c553
MVLLATTLIFQRSFADGEGKLDWVIASRDWVGGAPTDPSDSWMIGFGGRIYDNWYEALNSSVLPTRKHSAYPANGKFDGAETWRCKECHGWDYKGKDGAYGSGVHFTGIPGLRQLAGSNPKYIVKFLRSEAHGYTKDMLPDAAVKAVALFLARGQHDTDLYIDKKTGNVDGDPKRGRELFQNICAACHGFNGKAINFAEGEDEEGPVEYIGTIANNNPWEALHKILNGQPGEPMPAMRVVQFKDAIDILAYAQGLPVK